MQEIVFSANFNPTAQGGFLNLSRPVSATTFCQKENRQNDNLSIFAKEV